MLFAHGRGFYPLHNRPQPQQADRGAASSAFPWSCPQRRKEARLALIRIVIRAIQCVSMGDGEGGYLTAKRSMRVTFLLLGWLSGHQHCMDPCIKLAGVKNRQASVEGHDYARASTISSAR